MLYFQSTAQFISPDAVDPMVASSSTLSASTVISPIEIFIANVNRINEELQPLLEWTLQINFTRNPDELQDSIQTCQVYLP